MGLGFRDMAPILAGPFLVLWARRFRGLKQELRFHVLEVHTYKSLTESSQYDSGERISLRGGALVGGNMLPDWLVARRGCRFPQSCLPLGLKSGHNARW